MVERHFDEPRADPRRAAGGGLRRSTKTRDGDVASPEKPGPEATDQQGHVDPPPHGEQSGNANGHSSAEHSEKLRKGSRVRVREVAQEPPQDGDTRDAVKQHHGFPPMMAVSRPRACALLAVSRVRPSTPPVA